jgi:hypothetical protein
MLVLMKTAEGPGVEEGNRLPGFTNSCPRRTSYFSLACLITVGRELSGIGAVSRASSTSSPDHNRAFSYGRYEAPTFPILKRFHSSITRRFVVSLLRNPVRCVQVGVDSGRKINGSQSLTKVQTLRSSPSICLFARFSQHTPGRNKLVRLLYTS